jgi:hypothetical protein
MGEEYQMNEQKEVEEIIENHNIPVDEKLSKLLSLRARVNEPYIVSVITREIYHLRRRKMVICWLSRFDVKYHLTITFNVDLTESTAENYANLLLGMIRNEYFRTNTRQAYLHGVVIRERQENGTVHYHMLIFNNKIFKSKRNRRKNFANEIKDKCRRIVNRFIDEDGDEIKSHPIHPTRGWYLQDYFEGNLEEYLSKTLENDRLDFGFVAPLTYDGFVFEDKSDEISFARRSYCDKRQDGRCRTVSRKEYARLKWTTPIRPPRNRNNHEMLKCRL